MCETSSSGSIPALSHFALGGGWRTPKASSPAHADAAQEGMHCRGLQKQEKPIMETCEVYLWNIIHFAGEKYAKRIVCLGFLTVLPVVGVHLPLRQVVWILRNFAKYCESLLLAKFLQKTKLGVLLLNTHTFTRFRNFHSPCNWMIPCAAQALLFQQLLSQSFQFLCKVSGTSSNLLWLYAMHVWLLQKYNDCKMLNYCKHEVCLQNWCEIAKMLKACE